MFKSWKNRYKDLEHCYDDEIFKIYNRLTDINNKYPKQLFRNYCFMSWYDKINSELDITEQRLRKLECDEHEWEYKRQFVFDDSGFAEYYSKTCKKCGEEVEYIQKKEALQQQADMHYEKHCKFTEALNEEITKEK